MGGGAPDPYVSVSINQRAELARTTRKDSTWAVSSISCYISLSKISYRHNPTWHQTVFILINSLAEALTLTVLDHNEHRKDTPLGVATFELSHLAQDAIQEDLVANILREGKQRGEVRFDLWFIFFYIYILLFNASMIRSFYPVLAPTIVDGKEEPMPETCKPPWLLALKLIYLYLYLHVAVGIVRLTIHQAKELDHSKSITGELNPFTRVHIGSDKSPIFTTRKMKHTRDPVWEVATEFLCTNRSSSVITINVVDDRDFLADPILGYAKIKLDDLLQAKKESGKDWWPLSKCKSGRIRLSVEWKPLSMAGSLQGAGQYVPPIGIVRLWYGFILWLYWKYGLIYR